MHSNNTAGFTSPQLSHIQWVKLCCRKGPPSAATLWHFTAVFTWIQQKYKVKVALHLRQQTARLGLDWYRELCTNPQYYFSTNQNVATSVKKQKLLHTPAAYDARQNSCTHCFICNPAWQVLTKDDSSSGYTTVLFPSTSVPRKSWILWGAGGLGVKAATMNRSIPSLRPAGTFAACHPPSLSLSSG